ncbi:hypothetical protein [Candidatus Solincola sp.]|nr:hypothetical protein [Actinomycetota bacterium]MDI7252793.1 hypothetical protein [Actinomycetota bacterium]
MGKWGWRLAAVLLLATLAATALGCGRKGEGSTGPRISVERSGEGSEGSAVILHGEGTESQVEVWKFDPEEESLGTPVYPGAELVPGSALVSRTVQGERALLSHQAEYVTSDDYQAVVRWYREKMGAPLESDDREVAWVKGEESGVIRSVMAEETEEGTRIRIIRLSGDLDLRLEE